MSDTHTPTENTPAVMARRQTEDDATFGWRGCCASCGHEWRPRNPSPLRATASGRPPITRCPACQRRGHTGFYRIDH